MECIVGTSTQKKRGKQKEKEIFHNQAGMLESFLEQILGLENRDKPAILLPYAKHKVFLGVDGLGDRVDLAVLEPKRACELVYHKACDHILVLDDKVAGVFVGLDGREVEFEA